jgi:nicotinate-nucleotide adenylyltransferase
MAPFLERIAGARTVARHPRIKVSDIEARLGTRYTADTLASLKRRFPRVGFVWLMGADNLLQIPRWERWRNIFDSVPIAVFARPSYSVRSLSGQAARRYARRRLPLSQARSLPETAPPAWVFVPMRLDPRSATDIRSRRSRVGGPTREV